MATYLFVRVSNVWVRKLLQLIPEENRKTKEGGCRVLKAVALMCDATLDTLWFSSAAVALAVQLIEVCGLENGKLITMPS